MSERPISPLRQRMLEDMAVRRFGNKTRHDYIRHVEAFASFLGRSPDTATADDVRRFQAHLTESGAQPPKLNTSASALRFFFAITLDRPELAHRLARDVVGVGDGEEQDEEQEQHADHGQSSVGDAAEEIGRH